MRFGETFKISLFKFSEYQKLLLVRNFKTFLYVLFLALIMLLGIAAKISPVYIHYGSIEKLCSEKLPEFIIKDGRLNCAPYTYDQPQAGLYIKIDPSIEGEGELPSGYSQAAVVTATDINIRNNYKFQHESFKDIPDFSNQSIVNFFAKYEKKLLIGGAILLFLIFAIRLACNALIYALLGYVANVIFIHAPISFGNAYKLSIFASTFAVLLNTLLSLVGLNVASTIMPLIILFYLIKGIMSCRMQDGIVIETISADEAAPDDTDEFMQ